MNGDVQSADSESDSESYAVEGSGDSGQLPGPDADAEPGEEAGKAWVLLKRTPRLLMGVVGMVLWYNAEDCHGFGVRFKV